LTKAWVKAKDQVTELGDKILDEQDASPTFR